MMPGYQPIENYGVIGNMRTAALVGMDGSIDWLCVPHFDSPSVFAALLDAKKGGRFRIAPSGDDFRNKQFYWPDTNVLITRFLHADGIGEIEDYMPVGDAAALRDLLVRRCASSAAEWRSSSSVVRRSTMLACSQQCSSASTAPASRARAWHWDSPHQSRFAGRPRAWRAISRLAKAKAWPSSCAGWTPTVP